MPRKVRPAVDAAQNRQNQQRSRARRKAYLADLEGRLRELQDGGVRATLEMQRAAREVAWVNARLMELLAAKGVGRGEVDVFLRRAGESAGFLAPGAPLACGQALEGLLSEGVDKNSTGGEPACSRGFGADGRDTALDAGPSDNGPFIHVCDGVSETPNRMPGAAEGTRALLTSCDEAASIIADFQGHGDVLQARKALKCGDATDCHVKNTRLFQLMDESG